MAGPAPLGHHAGDQLLKQIGPRLVPLLATVNGEIARLGGDEFAVIVKGLRDEQAALAINLSPRVLADLGFVEETERILRRLALPPGCMRFEITETAMLADPARVIETITALNGLGIEFAVDDFGIGFSSLSYLKRLPLRRLKIDRSFVMQMLASEADASIVRSTINLGHDLGSRWSPKVWRTRTRLRWSPASGATRPRVSSSRRRDPGRRSSTGRDLQSPEPPGARATTRPGERRG